MNFKQKVKTKAQAFAAEKKTKLFRGDYDVTGKAKKGFGYLTAVGQNISDDMTPRENQAKMFPFVMPQEQQRRPQRRPSRTAENNHRYRPHRKRRRQREDRNPYPLI